MLRKAANKESKNWDELLPYLLFAYREIPQASTGFSPFEMLYGQPARSPLDVLKESWESSLRSTESVVSYVLLMQERLTHLRDLVRANLEQAQGAQKTWYDRNACSREFHTGNQVIVLLPTSINKLLVEWQAQSRDESEKSITRLIIGNRSESFISTCCVAGMHLPPFPVGQMRRLVTPAQLTDLRSHQTTFSTVLINNPGCTTIAEHQITLGQAKPVRLPLYRIPHAYQDVVRKELKHIEKEGIIPVNVVLVKNKDDSLRMCVDYRHLNAVSEMDAYPMPRVDDLIDRLGDAAYKSGPLSGLLASACMQGRSA